MIDFDAAFVEHFGSGLDKTPTKKATTLSTKELVLRKIDADLEALEGMTDIDELGYGTPSFPYINKKGEEVRGRMKSWSGKVNADGKREVRIVVGTSIGFDSEQQRIQKAVDNTLEAVTETLKLMRKVADGMTENEWLAVATNMAKVNKLRREKKAANKQS